MEIKENLVNLLAERYFKEFDYKRLSCWAQEQLNEGKLSDNLQKLAVGKEEELEPLFLKVLEEQFPNFKFDKKVELHNYALQVLKDFNTNSLSQEIAFLQMLKIAKASERDFRYIGFLEIEEDLERIFLKKKTVREGLSFENQTEYIREELKLFSAMERLNIPISVRHQEYCLICGQLTTPVLKRKYQIRRPFSYHVLCCEHCNSERLKPSYEHFVKRKIIESQL